MASHVPGALLGWQGGWYLVGLAGRVGSAGSGTAGSGRLESCEATRPAAQKLPGLF